MSIPDELIPTYARLAAFRSARRLRAARCRPCRGTRQSHGREEARWRKRSSRVTTARAAAARGARILRAHRSAPRDPDGRLPEIELGDCKRVAEVLVKAGFAESRRAAERLISGNAVKIDGEPVRDANALWSAAAPAVLSVGSRRFVRVLPNGPR